MRLKDITGQRFGMLYVLEQAENNSHNKVMWRCKCDCGNEAVVIGSRLRTGKTCSCGCQVRKRTIERNTKHGLSHTRLYAVRMSMYDRCYNERNQDYAEYGGRGITICKDWLDKDTGVMAFFDWSMKNGYNDNLTIDRIDVNGNYEPSNCRWVGRLEQAQARSRRKRKDNNSGVTGVVYETAKRKWVARITVGKKEYYLGAFDDFDSAVCARLEAETKHFKEAP